MGKSIVFVGGGQMAEAFIKGLLQSQEATPDTIFVVEPDPLRRSHLETLFQVTTAEPGAPLPAAAQTVILAVKPQVMGGVLADLKDQLTDRLVITVAAGLPLSFYASYVGDQVPVIRVMPNIATLVLAGASVLCRNQQVTDEQLAEAEKLFDSVGTTTVVEERLMDAVTGLSGSGPAFLLTFIEGLMDGGIKVGLDQRTARQLAIQTVFGTALLAQVSGEHPAELRARVTSPGGTAISGLQTMEEAGFRGTVMVAVEAAVKRSKELGGS